LNAAGPVTQESFPDAGRLRDHGGVEQSARSVGARGHEGIIDIVEDRVILARVEDTDPRPGLDVVSTGTPPRFGALSTLISRIPRRRRIILGHLLTAVVVAALAVAITMQVRRPGQGPVLDWAHGPLVSQECARGDCTSDQASDAQLAAARGYLKPSFTVSGTRITDPRHVMREVSLVASDGSAVVWVQAVRTSTPPAGWAAPVTVQQSTTATGSAEALRLRTVLRPATDRSTWIVEVQASRPGPLADLVPAVEGLSTEPGLVA
jgi:hypothetical protein